MTTPHSPYRGLAPFEDSESDVLFFFGREREREIIAANLMAARLTVLYGESGVGKSSVLRAGVVHHLRSLPEPHGIVVFDSWPDDPLELLRREIADACDVEPAGTLADTLALAAARVGGDVYVVLDQIEEFFLYHPSEGGLGSFVDEFSDAVTRPEVRASFLVSLREDAVAKLDRFKARIPNLFANSLRLEHLDRSSAREAIIGPVEQFNRLAGDGEVEIEPELVEAVLDEVAAGRVEIAQAGAGTVTGSPDGERVEAPYLQLVMDRVWQSERELGSAVLRLSTLRRLGGAEQIVRDHLEGAVEALTTEQKDVAAEVFDHLVTPSGTKIAHDASDLARYAGVEERATVPVLATLARERILRPVPGRGGSDAPRYEIYHDVLAQPVLAWRAGHEARRALDRQRSESESRHRRLLVVAAVALFGAAVMVGLTLFAFGERSNAVRAKGDAERAARAATAAALASEAQRKEALHAKAQAEAQRKKALAARAEAERQRRDAVAAKAQAEAQRRAAVQAKAREEARRREAVAAEAGAVVARQVAEQRRKEALAAKGQAEARRKEAVGAEHRAEARRKEAVAARANAERQARRARARELAATALAELNVDPVRSVGEALQAARLEPSVGVEDILRSALAALRLKSVLHGGGGSIDTAAFSPDGSLVLTVGRGGKARLFRPRSGALVRDLRDTALVNAASFSPDGRIVLTADRDGGARLWNASTGALVREFRQGGPVVDASFSTDGRLVVTASSDHSARVWETDTGRQMSLLGHDAPVRSARFSPDGRLIVTVSGFPTGPIMARVYDTLSGQLVRVLDEKGITSAAFSPDGKFVVTTSTDKTARLWDATSGLAVHVLQHDGHVVSAAFSPNGKLVVTASEDGSAGLWDIATGTRVLLLVGGTNLAESASFSPDGKLIIVARLDRSARIYRASDGRQVAVLLGHTDGVTGASFSPNGRLVLTAARDGTARVWDPGTEDQLELLGRHGGAVASASFSADGKRVVSASADGTARIWDVRTRRQLEVLHHGGPVAAAAFSTDGKLVVTASADSTAGIWSVTTGRELHLLRHGGPVEAAAFSPDGKRVVTASADAKVRIWSVATGNELRVLAHRDVQTVAFSPDGRFVVTGGADNTARLWRVDSGRQLHVLRHRGPVVRVAFSPDGRYVLTASGDKMARLWRADTGKLAHRLGGHTGFVRDAEFSRNGKLIVSASDDHDARIWDTATGRLIRVLRGHFTAVQTASFSPDGRWVVTAAALSAGLWQTRTGRLFAPTGLVTDPFLRGAAGPLTSASISPDGVHILTSSKDGTVRLFFCNVCGPLSELIRVAEAQLARVKSRK